MTLHSGYVRMFTSRMSRLKSDTAQPNQRRFCAAARAHMPSSPHAWITNSLWRWNNCLPNLLDSLKPEKPPEVLSRAQLLWLRLPRPPSRTYSCCRHRTNFLCCSIHHSKSSSFDHVLYQRRQERNTTSIENQNFTFLFNWKPQNLALFPKEGKFLDPTLWQERKVLTRGGSDFLILFRVQRT